jgi:3'-phosphoadenosine 5'-phosphosulfate sulfotransferase (PAPS reductase)/FAD synthetase
MSNELHVVGISGGKDSTALGLKLAEIYQGVHELLFLITPTGDELPDMVDHWQFIKDRVTAMGHRWLAVRVPDKEGGHHSLITLSRAQGILPSSRIRWCTKYLKIFPYKGYLTSLQKKDPDLKIFSYVGLRADEPDREGMYGGGIEYVYPLREWGWDVSKVWGYLDAEGIKIPRRTDCGMCPYQRLYEWYLFHKEHPEGFQRAIDLEKEISDIRGKKHTIRNDRGSWPAPLEELRAEFIEMDRYLAPYKHPWDVFADSVARHMQGDKKQNRKKVLAWRRLHRAMKKGLAREENACRVCTL